MRRRGNHPWARGLRAGAVDALLLFFIIAMYGGPPPVIAGMVAGLLAAPALLAAPGQSLLAGAYACNSDAWGPLYDEGAAWETQGIHGQSYGHYAVDYAGGAGTPVYSPVCGQVTANFVDEWNNTTLVIENGRYVITLLHGDWIVQEGQPLRAGQIIGYEGNNGYVKSGDGVLCNGRPNCGYHTHIDVKLDGQHVDPRDLGVVGPVNRQVDVVQVLQQPSAKPLKISWYDPKRGGINCDSDCSTMATGVKVTPDRYGRTAACIKPWTDVAKNSGARESVTVVIPGIGEFECLDRGGAIVETGEYIWIDLLLERPLVPFGSLQHEWYIKTTGAAGTTVPAPAPQAATWGDLLARAFPGWQASPPPGNLGTVAVGQPGGQPVVLPYRAAVGATLFPNGYHGASWPGRDYTVPGGAGTELVAPVTGVVARMGRDSYCGPNGCGNTYVLFRADDGTEVMLMHGRYSVQTGQRVTQCEPIGVEASEGNSSEAHTHISIRRGGQFVDAVTAGVQAACP